MRTPLSVRKAMGVIVAATLVTVFAGGALMTVVDREEYPDLGTGLWWALQTVTTVGYGDVTPTNALGRLVGALFMLEAIAFIAIVTAAITSSFVERARREAAEAAEAAGATDMEQLTAQLAELSAQVESIRRILGADGSVGARDG